MSSQFPLSLIRTRRNLNLLPLIPPTSRRRVFLQLRMMMTKKREQGDPESQSRENHQPRGVNELQQLLHSDSTGGGDWDKCWEQGLTPWDLGQPTPVIAHLHRLGALPKGRALVPGCGTGYDVVEIACPERHVTGLDISDNAINKALQLFSSLPNAMHFTFLKVDFFTWHPTELFDLIFDYTFFCAIEPDMRSAWAQKMRDILKPDGELITLMFPISDHLGGPPYKVSVSDYEEVLHPIGFKAISILDNHLAVLPRKGREKLGRWKRPAKSGHVSLTLVLPSSLILPESRLVVAVDSGSFDKEIRMYRREQIRSSNVIMKRWQY